MACAGETVIDAPPNRVVFENELFRIVNVELPPGTTLAEHAHEWDLATIAMRDQAAARTQVSGGNWGEAIARPIGSVETAEYTGAPGSHRLQNAGEGPYQLFAVENLRTGNWSSGQALSGKGVAPAAEGRAFGAYSVRLAEQTFQVGHVHSSPAVAVLISGVVLSQGAESKSDKKPAAPSGLKQLDQPGQWVFVPAGEPHYVVRLGRDPVHLVEVELR
jgi:quercetin dioxygenase-like cupin family protein